MDRVTVEIVRNRLRSVSKEMATTFTKTAFSPSLYDGRDCSTAILDASGQLLTLDCGVPLHIAPMAHSVREALSKFQGEVAPGDVFIMNDPYQGGLHLPDVLIFAPIFCEGELAFVAGARGHWTDVGGAVPGSLSGKAREIHQEGMIIPPVKLYRSGRLSSDVQALILSNMRVRYERAGDIRAALSACKQAERGCHALVERYGLDVVRGALGEALDASEAYFRSIIRALPDSRYVYEDYMDSDGVGDVPLRIRAAVAIEGDKISVDFEGTSAQARGPYNASLAVTRGAVFLAMKVVFDPHGPVNEGMLRPIDIRVPERTLLNAQYPAPTGGYGEVAYRTAFAVIGALASLVPDRVAACDYGAINHCFFGFIDDTTGQRSVLYAYAPPGGNGGSSRRAGASGMKGPIGGNVDIQSLELVENLHPVIYRSLRFRQDSGGAGRHRGGLGIEATIEVRKKAVVSVVSDRCEIPPFGLLGGLAGLPQTWEVRSGDGIVRFPGGKVQDHALEVGDKMVMLIAGGGGYGDPRERDVAQVVLDVIEGRVSPQMARALYAVVIDPETGALDVTATAALRGQDDRRHVVVRLTGRDMLRAEGPPRVVVGPDTLRFGLKDGSLIEVIATAAAPLRAVLGTNSEIEADKAWLHPETLDILGCSDGAEVRVRSLWYSDHA